MASVTATPLPALGIIKVIVEWLPYKSDPVLLYRVTPDGVRTPIIGSPVQLSGGYLIAYDTTPPFDVPLNYRAEIRRPVVSVDNFTRSVPNGVGWGSDEYDNNYLGTDLKTGVDNGRGVMLIDAYNSSIQQRVPVTLTNARIEGVVRAARIATGGFIQLGLAARWTGNNDFYNFAVRFNTDLSLSVVIERRTTGGGSTQVLASERIPYTYTNTTDVAIEAEISGSTLRMRAWSAGNKPRRWQLVTSDTTHTQGAFGYRATTSSTTTNSLPFSVFYYSGKITSLVPINMTSTTPVTLEAAPHGWIRDPRLPARSVRLDNCREHAFSCLSADRFVFFQGLEEESYASATGVFEILNSPNPIAVAQARKGLATSLRFVSTTLADISALRKLFSSGRELALSLPTEYGWGIDSYGTDSFVAGDVQVGRLNRRDMRKPQRLWSVPVRVTDRDHDYPTNTPSTNLIPAPGATYRDLQALGLTYRQLLGGGTQDDFNRTINSGGWGTPEVGTVPWSILSGPSGQFAVSQGVGRMAQTNSSGGGGGTSSIIVNNITHADIDMMVRFRWAATAAGAAQINSLRFRMNDTSNWWELESAFQTSGAWQIRLGRSVGGTTTYTPAVTVSGVTQQVFNWYWLRVRAVGSTIQGRAWAASATQPTTWQVSTTSTAQPTGTRYGLRGWRSASSTNPGPETLDWGSYKVQVSSTPGSKTYLDWAQGVYV